MQSGGLVKKLELDKLKSTGSKSNVNIKYLSKKEQLQRQEEINEENIEKSKEIQRK